MHDAQAQHDECGMVSGVSLTALLVASGRAVETARPDGLIRDPFAAGFVRSARAASVMPTSPADPAADRVGWRYLSDMMGIRSRFFDDYLRAAADAGIGQIVVLAAGLDTRAYRMSWPQSCQWFEIDQAHVLRFKHRVLAEQAATPTCQRHAVPADLREQWTSTLCAAGFEPARPSAWLAEGLLQYLPSAAEERLLSDISQLSAPGSQLAVTHTDGPTTLSWTSAELGVDLDQIINHEPRESLPHRLQRHGWTVRASESIPHAGQRLGRCPTYPAPDLDAAPSMLTWASQDSPMASASPAQTL
jgi:methyltransferase (TIGR00027 family)